MLLRRLSRKEIFDASNRVIPREEPIKMRENFKIYCFETFHKQVCLNLEKLEPFLYFMSRYEK